jgi:hypothetical protein
LVARPDLSAVADADLSAVADADLSAVADADLQLSPTLSSSACATALTIGPAFFLVTMWKEPA